MNGIRFNKTQMDKRPHSTGVSFNTQTLLRIFRLQTFLWPVFDILSTSYRAHMKLGSLHLILQMPGTVN